MRRRLETHRVPVLPRGWKDVIRQLLLSVGAYLALPAGAGLTAAAVGYKPFGDATKIIYFERLCTCSWSRASRRGR